MRERDAGLAQNRSGVPVSVLAALVLALAATPDASREPGIFLMGVWPDRILYFDEKTESVVGELHLRHGVANRTAFTPDYKRCYLITDRMESVEVVDVAKREVIDELKLSTEKKKVRFFGLAVDPGGKLVYLNARTVRLETDRFVDEKPQFLAYDLETRQSKVIELPKEIPPQWWTGIQVSPDGKSLWVLGKDIYILSAENYQIQDKIVLSKPLLWGYGPMEVGPRQVEPGLYYGIYRTTDPYLKKRMFGVARLDLLKKEVETFELGPNVRVFQFALSPDRKRGYGGLNDIVVVDMEQKKVLQRKENFEQGRTNNSMIVSADGRKLYVSGVGDSINVYDTTTLARVKTIFAGGDFMMAPVRIPRN